MKKRTIISLLLVACLATMCFVGGTFAKYTSTVTGTDNATVAKWAFKQGETDLALNGAKTITFDLFNTIKDTAGAEEKDVLAGKIAPGTSGSFTLNLKNESEVTATYDVSFKVTNPGNIPVKFYSDSAMTQEITDTDDVFSAAALKGTLDFTGSTKNDPAITSTDVTVYWQWAFNGNDVDDTALGINPTEIAVNATCVFTQVD